MLFEPRASDLDLDEVEAALLRAAVGDYAAEAAVLLLSVHGHWLPQLRAAGLVDLTVYEADPGQGEQVFAAVDWSRVDPALAARHVAGDSGQRRVLRAAESLAEGRPVDLADLTGGLDRGDLSLLLAAVAHAGGSHGSSAPLVPWPPRG